MGVRRDGRRAIYYHPFRKTSKKVCFTTASWRLQSRIVSILNRHLREREGIPTADTPDIPFRNPTAEEQRWDDFVQEILEERK